MSEPSIEASLRARGRELIQQQVLGTITPDEAAALERLLLEHRQIRADFRRACAIDAALRQEAAAQAVPLPTTESLKTRRIRFPSLRWVAAAMVMVGVGAAVFALGWWSSRPSAHQSTTQFVATLVAAQDCTWDGRVIAVGDRLTNTALTLQRGQATLVFDSGARLVLSDGAMLKLKDMNAVDMQGGRVSVSCPESAYGFTLTSPTATVVDMGTEFGVSVAASGATELHVFKGEVELSAPTLAKSPGHIPTELVQEGQGRRVISASSPVQTIAMNRAAFPRETMAAPRMPTTGRLLALEPFDYPADRSAVSNGGLGWADAWADVDPGDRLAMGVGAGTMDIIAPGFHRSMNQVLMLVNPRHAQRRLAQPLDGTRDPSLYLSFFIREIPVRGITPIGGANVMLRASSDPGANIRVSVEPDGHFSITMCGETAVSDQRMLEGRTYFLVARCDFRRDLPSEAALAIFDAETGTMTPEPVLWPVHCAKSVGVLPLDLVVLHRRGSAQFELDDIRLGTSWGAVTEPNPTMPTHAP